MKSILKRYAWSVPLLIGIAIVLIAYASNPREVDPKGELMPDFTLRTLTGEEVASEAYTGKVLLVNFWATWCGPCRTEIPDFIELQKRIGGENFQVVGIVVSSGESSEVQDFVHEHGINYDILSGDESVKRSLAEQFGGVRGIPTTFLIDREGFIRKKWIGAHSARVFQREISKYL